MKIAILVCLLSCATISTLAQDSLSNKSGYFIVTKRNNGVSQTLSVGDKVVINLKGNKYVHGRLTEANRDYILLDSKEKTGKIEIANIRWIKKTKAPTPHVVFGLILTAGGTAMLIPLLGGTVNLDNVEIHLAATIALYSAGIAFLTPPKYKLIKGDTMTFKE